MDYDYLVTGEVTKIRENGATSGVGVLATYGYDNLGNRTSVTFGNGVVQDFTYDPVSRLASLASNLSGTTNDLSATFAYNPASQIASTTRTGDAYAWTGHVNQSLNGTANGRNQLTAYGTKSLTHDAKGNVTAFGTKSFTYSSENLLLTGPGSTTLAYDPLMRLRQVVSGTTTNMVYDGLDRIAEYSGGNVQRRYVHGPGADEPMAWYEGSGTSNRRFLSADERGSIISLTDSAGALVGTGINRYDEYGQPQATNTGTWGYTGQAWLPSLGLWYYKARFYDPELGRFLQPDPTEYADSPNLYAYVLNDSINFVDPQGLQGQEIVVTGDRGLLGSGAIAEALLMASLRMAQPSVVQTVDADQQQGEEIVVTAKRQEARIGPVIRFLRWLSTKLIPKKIVRLDEKAVKDMAKRGWTPDDVKNAVENPVRTVRTRDTRHLTGGGRMDDPATAYYSRDGGYVVINDRTGGFVQASPRDLSGWRPPW